MPDAGRALVLSSATPVAHAASALDAFCAREAVPPEAAWRLRVALDEIVANVVTHGSVGGRMPTVSVSFQCVGEYAEIMVCDDGPPFDPLGYPAPDLTRPIDVRQPGGIGIALVHALIDEVRYSRTDCNVLTLRKRITAGTDAGGEGKDEDHPDHE